MASELIASASATANSVIFPFLFIRSCSCYTRHAAIVRGHLPPPSTSEATSSCHLFLFHCSYNHQHIEGPLMVTHQALDRQNKSTNSPIHSLTSIRNKCMVAKPWSHQFIHSYLALPALGSCFVTIANPACSIPSPRPFHPPSSFRPMPPLAIDNTPRNTANKMRHRAMTPTSKTTYPVSLI